MISTPSPVTRLPASRISRSRTPSGRDREFRTSNLSWTAVATLLTFCPPGPEERMNLSSMSPSSMPIFPAIRIIVSSYQNLVRGERGDSATILIVIDGGFPRVIHSD